MHKLKTELRSAIQDNADISTTKVKSLPYLNAVIQEAIHLHPGVMARQFRVSPEIPIVYKNPRTHEVFTIPSGTVTSMSPLDIHLHPEAFVNDAYDFRPQRWIDDPKLKDYFIGFSRGTRNCLGYVDITLVAFADFYYLIS